MQVEIHTMTDTYEAVKEAYEKEFSDDPEKSNTDPLFYMLEKLFFLFSKETRREKVEEFMDTFGMLKDKGRIAALLHYYLSQSQ